MADGNDSYIARIVENISDISARDWDGLIGDKNPFVSHAFLSALEETGCATEQTGWLPHHLIIQDETSKIIAASPLYIKSHSQGEYVFDHGWAHAWEQAGGNYYPKMQVSIPFSPVTGPRLLANKKNSIDSTKLSLIKALETVCLKLNLSSVHVTFSTENEWDLMGKSGWIQRLGRQYHWHNHNYSSFEDFLSELNSRKRKSIRRERRSIIDQGLIVKPYVGEDIRTTQWDSFYRFYVDTYDRKWGYPYLTREFFESIQERLGDSIVLMIAELDGLAVAGALNFCSTDTLYGRNWGCIKDFPFLHFETCYYQAIDFAIDNNLSRVEAGTQGPHKIQRGYEPVETYSAHFIPNNSFRDAVQNFCREEKREVEWEMLRTNELSPYKQKTT
ncbi:MAG: GNAT family N-acetyltransferase [Rhodospirillaceae bacterium]|nr:GNAT family N-acetyltransferase [Rhodospirillaceae bacterium]|tara:strand:+ start:2475 stop:3638 length:1164 start_codon:yes stop_codon:yes gene_type:complete